MNLVVKNNIAFWACCLTMVFATACQRKVLKVLDNNDQVIGKYEAKGKAKIKNGYYRIFHTNGNIALEKFYKNDKLQGEVKTFYENGAIESIAIVVDDSYEGEFKYFFVDGTLKQSGKYLNNQIEGELKSYYPNGQLKEIVFMSNSTENGPYTFYHQNGQLKEEGSFLEGNNKDGLIKNYSSEGILIKKQDCERGACQTIWKLYPDDNQEERTKEKEIDIDDK